MYYEGGDEEVLKKPRDSFGHLSLSAPRSGIVRPQDVTGEIVCHLMSGTVSLKRENIDTRRCETCGLAGPGPGYLGPEVKLRIKWNEDRVRNPGMLTLSEIIDDNGHPFVTLQIFDGRSTCTYVGKRQRVKPSTIQLLTREEKNRLGMEVDDDESENSSDEEDSGEEATLCW